METKRHKLLEILATRAIAINLREIKESATGVSYEEICKKLKCDRTELYQISSLLYIEKEVIYHNNYGVNGLCATEKGISSYTYKKYLRARNSRIKNNIKDIVSILIPVLSLIITILVILKNNGQTNRETQSIKERIQVIENKINKLKAKNNTTSS
ncbi:MULTISPECIES: hypothetical protein [Flavobacterium]|nr:hypothetical protein [Flavobacterium sp. N1846]